jgi:polar amino acid transport system substrate-binding protein
MKQFLLLLVTFLVFSQNAHAIYVDRSGSKRTLTIAADLWCPVNCDPYSAKPGVAVELASRAFANMGMDIRYVVMPWAEALEKVRSGKIDAIIGASRHDDPSLIFPAQAITQISDDFYVSKGDVWRFQGIYTLKNKKVGVVQGYGYGEVITNFITENKGKPGAVQFASGQDALKMNIEKLNARKIDVLVESRLVMDYTIQEKRLNKELVWAGGVQQGKVYLAFSPAIHESASLAVGYDKAIQALRESGELEKIYKRYNLRP